jgi:hypothetical protein
MKNLARTIIACFAAQLLFVGIANAKVTTSKIEAKSHVFVMPDSGSDGPFDEFLAPDSGSDGPFDEFLTPDGGCDGPFEGW